MSGRKQRHRLNLWSVLLFVRARSCSVRWPHKLKAMFAAHSGGSKKRRLQAQMLLPHSASSNHLYAAAAAAAVERPSMATPLNAAAAAAHAELVAAIAHARTDTEEDTMSQGLQLCEVYVLQRNTLLMSLAASRRLRIIKADPCASEQQRRAAEVLKTMVAEELRSVQARMYHLEMRQRAMNPAAAAKAAVEAAFAAALHSWDAQHVERDAAADAALDQRAVRLAQRGVKVPKSNEHWVVVGLFLASRDFPDVPFFLPLVDVQTGRTLQQQVPYQEMMRALVPTHNDRKHILLHVRVVQRLDAHGRLFGDVRYVCTDIAVSYHMGDNAFKWILFQSAHMHTLALVRSLACGRRVESAVQTCPAHVDFVLLLLVAAVRTCSKCAFSRGTPL